MSASPTSPSIPSPPSTETIRQLEIATGEAIPLLIRQARDAWRRDLPSLLQTHPGRWVAYHGEQRVALGGTKTALVQHCLRTGLQRG